MRRPAPHPTPVRGLVVAAAGLLVLALMACALGTELTLFFGPPALLALTLVSGLRPGEQLLETLRRRLHPRGAFRPFSSLNINNRTNNHNHSSSSNNNLNTNK